MQEWQIDPGVMLTHLLQVSHKGNLSGHDQAELAECHPIPHWQAPVLLHPRDCSIPHSLQARAERAPRQIFRHLPQSCLMAGFTHNADLKGMKAAITIANGGIIDVQAIDRELCNQVGWAHPGGHRNCPPGPGRYLAKGGNHSGPSPRHGALSERAPTPHSCQGRWLSWCSFLSVLE